MPLRALVLAVALLALLLPARQACAHASLIKAEPADGAVVAQPPAALTLVFNEPVSPLVMRLIGPGGELIPLGAIAAENTTVTVATPPALRPGSHVLSWRVMSADGHPVAGALIFSIGAPSAPPALAPTGDPSVRAALWAAKVVIYAGLFIGIGGAFFRAWIADPGSSVGVRPLAAIVAAGLVATLVSVGLQGLDALALPLSDLRQQFVWRSGLATSYGATAIVAGIALLAGLFSLVATSAPAAGACALVALAGVGLAPALSGHAATAAPRLITAPALFLHGIGVAFWIGALLPLALRQRDAGRPALARFSRVIPYPLVLIVVTGGALAVVQLGRLDALWTTSYGLVLAGKLVAVLALLMLAALNRYALVPRFEAAGAGTAARPLALSIGCELVLALAILALVALWRFTPPPRALLATAPISLHLHGQQAMAQIELVPAQGQGARVSLQVLDGGFQPLAAKEVALVLANAAAGIEPLRRTAAHAGDSNWRIDDLRIPVAGQWRLRVEILVTDFDKVMLEQTVALPRTP